MTFDEYRIEETFCNSLQDEISWDMLKIQLPLILPPTLIGEWRFHMATVMEYKGKTRKQCIFFRADVFEI